jgi:molybdopterin molybdotransferase
MILFEDALNMTLSETLPIDTEQVPLGDGLGRFLAAPVDSPIDAPPFDKSAMDGYAVRADDDRDSYHLRETIAAGDSPNPEPLGLGEAAKIMTGAPLPAGAGRVIRVEFTELSGDTVRILQKDPYRNIIERGENLKAGDPLLTPCRLGPKEIGCLAAAGFATVTAFRRLRVGVITTGDEIREPGSILGPGEIFNSNGPQLVSQITSAGADPVDYGTVADDRELHRGAIVRGLDECDFLLLTGGVSKGDFDYVPEVLEGAGVLTRFHGVRIKPGRPTLFGRTDNTLVFGLPGNPVSVFVIFEVLVRPLIHRLQGAPDPAKHIRGTLTQQIKRTDVERAEFLPATLAANARGVILTPLRYGGSSHLNALADADALISVPARTEHLEPGDLVDARLL